MKINLLFRFILCLWLLFGSSTLAVGQNVAMHFDGVDDYLIETSGVINSYDFTVEGWFNTASTSTGSSCTQAVEVLWYSGHNREYFLLGECDGELVVSTNTLASGFLSFPTGLAGDIRGGWHHIAVTFEEISPNVVDFKLYIDCQFIFRDAIATWTQDIFALGTHGLLDPDFKPYHGAMDDIKIHAKPIIQQQICDNDRCIPTTARELKRLRAFYSFDEGDPDQDNTGRTTVADQVGNRFPATLNGFALLGSSSNYINSTSPVFPRTDLICPLITSVPFQMDTLDQICGTEPVHLCLNDTSGKVLPTPPYLDSIRWVYTNNNGGTFSLIDTALGDIICGVASPGAFMVDCSTSTLGYEDWEVRGELKFKDQMDSCYHLTKPVPLRVCCSLDSLKIDGSTNHPMDLLCDMDTVDFTIDLLPNYPFLRNAASGVTIDWSFNGTALPQFANQTSFNYNNIIIDVATGACFQAVVDFPICGKKATIDLCFLVDPRPICGTIDTLMMPTALTQLSASPKIYEICPGDDAALKIDDPFFNCIPHWEYCFDLSVPTPIWYPMGATNSQQNTNIIPTAAWPGSQIYYRIECRPINDPSGCEPCYSDTLEIRLQTPLVAGTILGKPMVCEGDNLLLTHSGFDPTLTHQWYCNGMPVGNGGPTLTATMTGCYWVESTDGCEVISTPKYCTMFCEVVATISCPDVCPRPGVPITLSGCDSFDTCGKPLTYQWQVSNGPAPTINGCQITHIPDPAGTTYTLIVLNSIGCADMTSVTIVPCAQ